MKDWKSQFTDVILERGKDYYDQGAVKSLVHSSLGYAASVQGTELYDVEIRLEDHEVVDMYCSCPHAESGYNCKHMAAVLYALENNSSLADCINLIDNLSKKQLSQFIKMAVERDISLREELVKFVNPLDYKKCVKDVDDVSKLSKSWKELYKERKNIIDKLHK